MQLYMFPYLLSMMHGRFPLWRLIIINNSSQNKQLQSIIISVICSSITVRLYKHITIHITTTFWHQITGYVNFICNQTSSCLPYIPAIFPGHWSFTLQSHQTVVSIGLVAACPTPPLFHQQPVSVEESEKQKQQEVHEEHKQLQMKILMFCLWQRPHEFLHACENECAFGF